MRIDSTNVSESDLLNCLNFKIRIIGISHRRASNLHVDGRENCSGYNINKSIFDGMTVHEYQQMIKLRFAENDPQFSLTKHLKYDIEKGFIVLEG
ncbi:hypothetical protein [Phytobacter sp. V91]|uniref:hypothetical protein n=1 Tax=Phytobacter sp. V91 TaxID=3369425 RepID=UPI003F618C9F